MNQKNFLLALYRRKLTFAEAAEKVGVSERTLLDWVMGNKVITLKEAWEVGKSLGITDAEEIFKVFFEKESYL